MLEQIVRTILELCFIAFGVICLTLCAYIIKCMILAVWRD